MQEPDILSLWGGMVTQGHGGGGMKLALVM